MIIAKCCVLALSRNESRNESLNHLTHTHDSHRTAEQCVRAYKYERCLREPIPLLFVGSQDSILIAADLLKLPMHIVDIDHCPSVLKIIQIFRTPVFIST